MRVFITGGTGVIGRRIVAHLKARGDQAVVLSRNPEATRNRAELRGAQVVAGDPSASDDWAGHLNGCDGVINLAGHNIFANRWNGEIKRKIRDSRVYGTQHLVAAIRKASKPPTVLVHSSAIGYYGSQGDEELTESSPPGSDFMAKVCREWEDAAHPAEALGVRVASVRTGIVLAQGDGALGVMTPVFRWLPGGAAPVGSGGSATPATGRQWMSWIHLDDIARLFVFALDRPEATGAINGTAPHPERNADFSRVLAKVVHRPFVPFGPPDFLMRLMLGEVAQVVAEGQRVLPARAQALGFTYRFPTLREALQDLFAKTPAPTTPNPVPAGAGH